MAKGKVSQTGLSSVSGRIGSTDRTVGRNGGLALNMTDNTPDGSVKLGVKTAMPPGGSPARHNNVEHYCECDRLYKLLDYMHVDRIKRWFTSWKQIKELKLTPYMIWIKVCILNPPERFYFVRYSWYGRWLALNDSDVDYHFVPVTLRGMKRRFRTPYDGLIFSLDDDFNILEYHYPLLITDSTVMFQLPLLAAHSHLYFDIYWLYNPPPNWG